MVDHSTPSLVQFLLWLRPLKCGKLALTGQDEIGGHGNQGERAGPRLKREQRHIFHA
jgi:hypothetical protein